MKQKVFFGVRKDSEKSLYVRKGDNEEILVNKVETGSLSKKKMPFTLTYKKPVCWVFNC